MAPKTIFTEYERKVRNAANMFRYNNGLKCTLDEAVKLYQEAKKTRKKKNALIALAESNGIDYRTYQSRLRRGWDAETAATEPVQNKLFTSFSTDDERNLHSKAAAIVRNHGYSMSRDEAVEIVKAKEAAKANLAHWVDIAEKNGISRNLFNMRRYLYGASMQQAATTPKYQKMKW